MKLFTIITITYQNVKGLQKTASSINAQKCQDFEWLVIDGKSSDGTREFLATQACVWDSEPDAGIYDAMNKGIERAAGRYVIFMNAGDVFAAPDVLQKIKGEVEKCSQSLDLIYGDALESGHYKCARHHTKIQWGMFTHHQSMLYNMERLKQFRYDQNHNIAADYDLTCQFLQGAGSVKYINIPICNFEPGGLSQQSMGAGRRQQYQIRKALALCSTWHNIMIYSGQTILSGLRQFTPSVYWFLKRWGS